jgi:hypothetical protein
VRSPRFLVWRRHMNENEMKKINGWRIFFSIIYFVSFVVILIFSHKRVLREILEFEYLYRFFWCLASSFFGFSVIAFRGRYNPKSPFPEYLTYYLPLLIVISSLVFSGLYLLAKTSGILFYSVSFTVCFILGYLVDSFWEIVVGIFKKYAKK